MTRAFDPTRRALLKYSALSAAGFTLLRGNRVLAGSSAASAPLDELGYAQVQLLDRRTLLSARTLPHADHRWRLDNSGAPVELRAFPDIDAQTYSTYQTVS